MNGLVLRTLRRLQAWRLLHLNLSPSEINASTLASLAILPHILIHD